MKATENPLLYLLLCPWENTQVYYYILLSTLSCYSLFCYLDLCKCHLVCNSHYINTLIGHKSMIRKSAPVSTIVGTELNVFAKLSWRGHQLQITGCKALEKKKQEEKLKWLNLACSVKCVCNEHLKPFFSLDLTISSE